MALTIPLKASDKRGYFKASFDLLTVMADKNGHASELRVSRF